MKSSNFITEDSSQTKKLGRDFISKTNKRIIALHGELGSGKTTFTQGVAEGLGIKNRIISPTFVIIRSYRISNGNINKENLYHVDLYRINNEKDIVGMELLEIINNQKNIVVIEWPEKIGKILPEKTAKVNFTYIGDSKRGIKINE